MITAYLRQTKTDQHRQYRVEPIEPSADSTHEQSCTHQEQKQQLVVTPPQPRQCIKKKNTKLLSGYWSRNNIGCNLSIWV